MNYRSQAKLQTLLKEAINSELSIEEFLKSKKLTESYFDNFYKTTGEDEPKYKKEILEKKKTLALFHSLFNKGKNIPKKSKPVLADKADNDHCTVLFSRDNENKIKSYDFEIYVTDKPSIVGSFSREEMNLVYRLYTNYGSSITQREVSRFFHEYSLNDFKRILKAFNITKACAPFAPHMIEENSVEELTSMQFRAKESDLLRSIDSERIKNTEKLLKNYICENIDLKRKIQEGVSIFQSIDISSIEKWNIAPNTGNHKKDGIFWLSDMHVGAKVSSYSLYENKYDEEELYTRLSRIIQEMQSNLREGESYDNLVIANIGDSLDGLDQTTGRRSHLLPQNMDNKEQISNYMKAMLWFFKTIKENVAHNSLHYYCVGQSNHDSCAGWQSNVALAAALAIQDVHAEIFNKFIGYFYVNEKAFLICHGKDDTDMKSGLPLILNDKTENFINEYMDYEGIPSNAIFVKGDLHQSATSYGRRFTYKSVSSFFGSSNWVQVNYGNTKAACDYTIIDNNNILDGRIILN